MVNLTNKRGNEEIVNEGSGQKLVFVNHLDEVDR